MSQECRDKNLSRRDLFRRSGALGVGILAAAGCGSTSEEIFVNNNNNGNIPGPTPTPTPTPNPSGGALTFQFVKAQAATVPLSTAAIEFVYLNSANAEISSETKPFATSITVFPPDGTQAVLLIARDGDGFPLLELQGAVTVPPEGEVATVNLTTFADTAVTFDSLSVTPPQFDLTVAGQTQQLSLSAGFSNGESIPFSSTLLSEATYASSNDAFATVNGSGLVTAVATGDATITVSFTSSTGQLRSDTSSASVMLSPDGPVIPPVSFVQPPVRRSENGFLSVLMSIDFTSTTIPNLPTMAMNPPIFSSRKINGTLAPPTIRVKPGDRLEIPIDNLLPDDNDNQSETWQGPVSPANENTPHEWNTVNMHTHGLHVSPSQDNVLLQILPGSSYTYQYDIPSDHPPGTFWYHPHKHGGTAMHLFGGMIGSLIVEGGLDEVPEIAAAADLIFNINELALKSDYRMGTGTSYGTNNSLPEYFVPNFQGTAFSTADAVYVVNGEYQPTMTVRPGQLVRLRILNASARGATPLTITGATNDWNIIAFDGLTLPEMLSGISEFTLAPANRADVLVRFDTPGTYNITKKAVAPGGGGVLAEQILAFIEVAGDPFPQDFPSGTLPVSPTLPDITEAEVTPATPANHRTLVYNTGPFRIGDTQFSSSTINQTIALGSVVEWRLENPSNIPHPHHIHIHPVQVIATSDGLLFGIQMALPGQNFAKPVWVDTVGIPPNGGWVIIRQRFPDFPGLFVQHCHILTHEDQGMMQLVNVV